MFYYLISTLYSNNSDSKDLDPRSKLLRIFLGGTVLYVILHSFIYSKFVESRDWIVNNRKYIYYIILSDLMITGYLTRNKLKEKKRKNKLNKEKFNNPPLMLDMEKLSQVYKQSMIPNTQPYYGVNNNMNTANNMNNMNNMNNNVQNRNSQQYKPLNYIPPNKSQLIEVEDDSTEIPIYKSKSSEHVSNNDESSLPIYEPRSKNDVDIPIYKKTI